jgi:BASS family bile acid:Na+ symporter
MQFIESFSKKYFSFIILLGGLSGLIFPKLGESFSGLVMPSLFILMFFTALKIDLSKILYSIKKPLPLFVAILISYILIPLILYILADFLYFNNQEKLSVMFSALAPSILSAPYFISIMKGDVEFSFILTIILTFLAPFLIPLELLFIFDTQIDFPIMSIFSSISILVFIPLGLVVVLKKIFPSFIIKTQSAENSFTSLMFFIFTWAIISINAQKILNANFYIYSVVVLSIIQEFGFFIFLRWISKFFLNDAMSKSFAFSIAVKNTVLTAGVAMLYSNDIALMSSLIVLIHIPMFAWVLYKKDKI